MQCLHAHPARFATHTTELTDGRERRFHVAQTRIMDAHLRADVPAQNAYTERMRKLIAIAHSSPIVNGSTDW